MTDKVTSVIADLTREFSSRGFQFRLVGYHQVQELQRQVTGLFTSHQVGDQVHQQYAQSFDYNRMPENFQPTSVICVSGFSPILKILCHWQGTIHSILIPPTYADFQPPNHPEQVLQDVLAPHGFRFARARVPAKLVATRGGLAQYGRNNISYSPVWGSFHRLLSFYTDLPAQERPLLPLTWMTACEKCSACRNACPTGAILKDRELIDATKCLTLHNEAASPFLPWIQPTWHNCLIGCLRCQHVCPANKHVKDKIDVIGEWSEEETQLLVDGKSLAELTPNVRSILERIGLTEEIPTISRNLRVLLPL